MDCWISTCKIYYEDRALKHTEIFSVKHKWLVSNCKLGDSAECRHSIFLNNESFKKKVFALAMNTYKRSTGIAILIPNVRSTWRFVPALPSHSTSGKEPLIPIEQEAGWGSGAV
jgi:hypothetical protein